MRRRFLYLTSVLAALLVAASGPTSRPPTTRPTVVDWGRYPQTDAMNFFRRQHESAEAWGSDLDVQQQPPTRAVVAVSWFLGPITAVQYAVTVDGRKWDRRMVYNWAIQNEHEA